MKNSHLKKYIHFPKERYSTWNFVKKSYSSINILQEYTMLEEKVIISPKSKKLLANESCVIFGITIKRPQKNKLPGKSIKPITIKWTNQWKRFEDETAKLKPPDKKPSEYKKNLD
jgi:hypothetical protein